jgi:hypothetical protein
MPCNRFWGYFDPPMDFASRWRKIVISEGPSIVAQHIKASLEDHGRNCIGDVIVIRLRPVTSAGGVA